MTVLVKYCTSLACCVKFAPVIPTGNISVNLTSFITLFFADKIDSVASDNIAPWGWAVPYLPAFRFTLFLPWLGNLSLPAANRLL